MTRHHRPHPPLAPLADRVPRRDCPWIYAHSIHSSRSSHLAAIPGRSITPPCPVMGTRHILRKVIRKGGRQGRNRRVTRGVPAGRRPSRDGPWQRSGLRCLHLRGAPLRLLEVLRVRVEPILAKVVGRHEFDELILGQGFGVAVVVAEVDEATDEAVGQHLAHAS